MKDEQDSSPIVTIVGDSNRDEVREVVHWVKSDLSPSGRMSFVPDIPGLVDEVARGMFADLVIVLQAWPNEYSREDVDCVFSCLPLARVVVCYGAWCESDGRNQNLWPLSVRVPLWQARKRIQREWQLIHGPDENQPVPWSASREEVFEADHPGPEKSSAPVSFLVDSPDPAFRQFLIELMTCAGHKPIDEQPDVVLFDADPWCPDRLEVLNQRRLQSPNACVVGLVDFQLPTLTTELTRMGVNSVACKLGFNPSDHLPQDL